MKVLCTNKSFVLIPSGWFLLVLSVILLASHASGKTVVSVGSTQYPVSSISFGSQSIASTSELSEETIRKNLFTFIGLTNSMRGHIDTAQFDIDQLLDQLDYDFDRIVAFASNEIHFEYYSGVLRGPLGTLLSRAGNSLDQSLFLARMLRDAGYDARIQQGVIESSDHTRLIRGLESAAEYGAVFRDDAKADQIIAELRGSFKGEPKESDKLVAPISAKTNESLEEIVGQHVDIIHATLKEAGVVLGEGVVEQAALPGKYYWVSTREGARDHWKQIHPAFAGRQAPVVEVVKTYVSEVPAELAHRVRIQAKIRRKVGDRIEVLPIMEAWERPAANLAGIPLKYENYAESISGSEFSAGAIDTARLFFPRLNQANPPGGLAFDIYGNVVDPSVAGSAMAGVFRSVGESFASVAGALSSEDASGKDSSLMRLEEHWLEITLISPDGTETVHKRTLWDASGGVDERARRLSSSVTFAVFTGRIPPAYMVDKLLQRLSDSEHMLPFYFRGRGASHNRQRLERADNYITEQLLFKLLTQELGRSGANTISYIDAPQIVAYNDHVWLENNAYSGFDLVSNSRSLYTQSNTATGFDPAQAISSGVWDTVLEHFVVPPGGGASTILNPFGVNSSATGSQSMAMISNADDVRLELGSPLQREAMRRDLRQGNVLVVPMLDGSLMASSWWRVHPAKGVTLGMSFQGWGASPVKEYDTQREYMEWLSCIANLLGKCRGAVNWFEAIGAVGLLMGQGALKIPPGAKISWSMLLKAMHRAWLAAGGGLIGSNAAYLLCYKTLRPLVCPAPGKKKIP
jgi:hypothetical protein